MSLKQFIKVGVLLGVMMQATERSYAQNSPIQIYHLISGSELLDDCPICDRVPIPVPMTGTIGLRLLVHTPLTTRYQLLSHPGIQPALQFRSIIQEPQTASLRLEWQGNGGKALLEGASHVDGPYSPLTPLAADQSFTDVGVLTNRTHRFDRLRQD